MLKKSYTQVIILSLLINGCQTNVLTNVSNTPKQGVIDKVTSEIKQVVDKSFLQPKFSPYGTITSTNNTDSSKNLSFTINYDALAQGFSTKAVSCGQIAKVKVAISGINISTPIYADGADTGTHTITNSGCTYTNIQVSNVPYGRARIATIEAYDSSDVLIPGATIMATFDVNSSATTVEISQKGSPNARVIDEMLGTDDLTDFITTKVNLADLATFINTLTGVSVGNPDSYTYTTHPSLINAAEIAADLIANGGNAATLNTSDASYKITAGQVSGTISDLVDSDLVDIRVDDPASSVLVDRGNGSFTINNVTPGSWKVYFTTHGNIVYTAEAPVNTTTIDPAEDQSIGSISFDPANAPTITNFTPTSGEAGDTIVITGTNFYPSIAGNKVFFGSTAAASVTYNGDGTLSAVVPTGLGNGTSAVKVSVGTASVTGNNYTNVVPSIDSYNPTSVFEGDTVTINGNGFVGVSSVTIGGVQATNLNTSGAPTSISVTVPSFNDTQTTSAAVVINKTGSPAINSTSNLPLLVNVPSITSLSADTGIVGDTITITGTNFHPALANNKVFFGSTQVSPSVVNVSIPSANTLTVTVPSLGEGPQNVTVKIGSNTSNQSTFTFFIKGELQVNSYTTSDQINSNVAMDSNGNSVITWQSNSQDGNKYGIYAQRYNNSGVKQGPEFLVNSNINNNQTFPSVAMDSDGDFVISWQSENQDGANYGIYAQRYNSSGIPQGPELQVNSTTIAKQSLPTVAMDSDGDFVISWQSGAQDGSLNGIYAQRYSSSGVPQGPELQVNSFTTSDQINPSVAMDNNGDFVISWFSNGQDGSGYGVYAQRYNSSGIPQGSELQVNSNINNSQSFPSVAMDIDGDFVISWQSDIQDGANYGIFAQRYSSSGVPQGPEFQVNSYTTSNQFNPSVAMDNNGDFVISWFSNGQDGSGYGVYAQRYNSSGVPQGPEFQVNSTTFAKQSLPSVAMDIDGDFVISWQSEVQDGDGYGIYAKMYTSAGIEQ
jgi:hypothetical protein